MIIEYFEGKGDIAASVGISEERTEELMNKVREIGDLFDNGRGDVSINTEVLFKMHLEVATTIGELVFMSVHAGSLLQYLQRRDYEDEMMNALSGSIKRKFAGPVGDA